MPKETIKIKVKPHELIRSAETIKDVLIRKIERKIKRNNIKILHAIKTSNPYDTDYYCTISYEE